MKLFAFQLPLLRTIAATAIALVCAGLPARAGFMDGSSPGDDPNPIFIPDAEKKVSVVEHLAAPLPADATFADETGKFVRLGDYFLNGKRPVILQIGYFRCPMLCSQISRGLVDSLKQVRLDAGPDYEVIFVSIDPKETPELAAAKKQSFLDAYAHDGSTAGWHLLTGTKDQIDRVTAATGVEYRWVERAQQYSHPAVVVLCSPQGRITRYLHGVQFDPSTLRLSLVEASNGRIGSSADDFILTCFQYDGAQGKYALAAIGVMKVGGVVTIFAIALLILFFSRRKRAMDAAGQAFEPAMDEPRTRDKN